MSIRVSTNIRASCRPALRVAAAGFIGLAAAACGSSSTVTQSERTFTERFLFAGSKLPEPTPSPAARRDLGCPAVQILSETAAYRVGDPSGARGISHQASINDYARECRPEGDTMRIKVGVQGRLLLGDSGKPGTITVPVRIAVRGNGQTLYSKLHPVAVTIPPNDTQAPFILIDEQISVPITAADPGEQYSILIGLDPQGTRPERRRRR